jgi:hypothetical protein
MRLNRIDLTGKVVLLTSAARDTGCALLRHLVDEQAKILRNWKSV